eukprot:3244456-Amphidinium_carterae.1
MSETVFSNGFFLFFVRKPLNGVAMQNFFSSSATKPDPRRRVIRRVSSAPSNQMLAHPRRKISGPSIEANLDRRTRNHPHTAPKGLCL